MVPIPEFYTVAEVAKLLKLSQKAVIRRFGNLPGVVDLGSPETMRPKKRSYRVLRIPAPVLAKYLMEHAR